MNKEEKNLDANEKIFNHIVGLKPRIKSNGSDFFYNNSYGENYNNTIDAFNKVVYNVGYKEREKFNVSELATFRRKQQSFSPIDDSHEQSREMKSVNDFYSKLFTGRNIPRDYINKFDNDVSRNILNSRN